MQYGHLILFDYNHTIYNGLFVYIGLCIIQVILDGYVSNHFGKNIITLRQAGKYTDHMISSIVLYNLISTHTLTWFIFRIICNGMLYDIILSWYQIPISMYQYSYISYIVFAVTINICITELLFYYGHKLLHEKYPSFYIMHHCCLLPSNLTNFIFHPIDMIIEFGSPGIFLLLSHYIIWKQNISIMMLSYSIVQIYYSWDHSEYLKTYHYHHHTHHDAVYTIYMKYKSNPKLDQIRHYILKTNHD